MERQRRRKPRTHRNDITCSNNISNSRQEDNVPATLQQLQQRHRPSTAEPAIDQRLLQLQRSASKTSASPTTQLQRTSTSGNITCGGNGSGSGTTSRALSQSCKHQHQPTTEGTSATTREAATTYLHHH
jgi:hypothetical protein